MNAPRRARRPSGFTLVDTMLACAVAAVVAGIALPGYQAQIVKSRRADAVQALETLRRAQEGHRDAHGRYAATLDELRLPAASPARLYTLSLQADGAARYVAAAAPAGDAQAGDAECRPLTLTVDSGFAREGPTRRCWNR